MSDTKIKLTNALLEQVIMAVTDRTGNVVGEKQLNMIESRLTKRAMTLGIADEADYIEYFKKNRETEIEDLISILTVHHSFFFREFGQFEYLGTHVLPNLISQLKAEGRNKIRVWSAACSRGQEVYSLFMFIDQYLKTNAPSFTVEILGTDVDRESVKFAANGVYTWNEVKEIPFHYLSKYWSRGTGEIAEFAKMKDSARKACTFKQANLMETASFSVFGKFDIIFCRNVFIYFQKTDVMRIAEALASSLYPSGYFFVGLSESLSKNPQKLKKLGPSMYGPDVPKPQVSAKTPAPASPIRVFCVDDSGVILKLLKSILTTSEGFEVVGTADNGLEAAKMVSSGLQFDVMTLDVHMPEMTGVEYLEQKFTKSHPPVVMLTSASRDNMDLAHKALKLGAKDYIEKPTLGELKQRSDEIRSKLRSVCKLKMTEKETVSSLKFEQQFQSKQTIKHFENKANVIFTDDQKISDLLSIVKSSDFSQAPCIIVNMSEMQKTDNTKKRLDIEPLLKSRFKILDGSALQQNLYYCSFTDFAKWNSKVLTGKTVCYSVLSNLNRSQWAACYRPITMKILILEDIDRSVFLSNLSSVFSSPASSFAYTSKEFFSQSDAKLAG